MTAARARAAALLLPALGAAAASCTAGPTSPASPAPASAALRTVDFDAQIPAGWSDVTSSHTAVGLVRPAGTLLLLLEAPPSPPVHAGVNDVEAVITVTRLDQTMQPVQFSAYLGSVASHGATQVSPPQPVTVGGAAGTSVTYQSSSGGTPGETQDMVVDQGGATYEIELSTARFAFGSQAGALRSLLASWRWVTPD